MHSQQDALLYVKDQMQRGLMTADEANVEMILMMGVSIVRNSLPAQVRKTLNAAVKAGKLGRLPKKDMLPEAYFHPNSRANAIAERQRIMRETLEALKKVCI